MAPECIFSRIAMSPEYFVPKLMSTVIYIRGETRFNPSLHFRYKSCANSCPNSSTKPAGVVGSALAAGMVAEAEVGVEWELETVSAPTTLLAQTVLFPRET